jgi:hypothetical protein
MKSQRVESYRRKADDARKRAEAANDASVKESWLRLAEDWTILAQSVEAEELRLEGKAKGEWSRGPSGS